MAAIIIRTGIYRYKCKRDELIATWFSSIERGREAIEIYQKQNEWKEVE